MRPMVASTVPAGATLSAARRVFVRLPPPGSAGGGGVTVRMARAIGAAAAVCGRSRTCAAAADVIGRTLRVWLANYAIALVLFGVLASVDYWVCFHLCRSRCHPGYTLDEKAVSRLRRHAASSVWSLGVMSLLAAPWDVAAAAGADRRYDTLADHPGGAAYAAASAVLFLVAGETYSYWLHRALHSVPVLVRLHAEHHAVGAPTPFAAFAFHPLDGYAQGLYFHAFPFLVPVHRGAYAAFMAALSAWSVLVHDGVGESGGAWGLMGGGAHARHHGGGGNFGQFTMAWDWACGTLVREGEKAPRRRQGKTD
ncbi:hypothetical protein MMPV_003340 [Pyropia vietnamensis]